MTTVSVWVLVFLMYGGAPTVIDNITTHDECEKSAQALKDMNGPNRAPFYRCVQVQKVAGPLK